MKDAKIEGRLFKICFDDREFNFYGELGKDGEINFDSLEYSFTGKIISPVWIRWKFFMKQFDVQNKNPLIWFFERMI